MTYDPLNGPFMTSEQITDSSGEPGYAISAPDTAGSDNPQAARSHDGRSVWEFYAPGPGQADRFLVSVAMLRQDGEGEDGDGEPWVMENDDAYDTLAALIGQARDILGWQPGTAPLDHPDYLRGD